MVSIIMIGIALLFFSSITFQFAPDLYFKPVYVMTHYEQILAALGRGLVSFGILFLILIFIFKIRKFTDIKYIYTLNLILNFFLIANMALVYFIPAFFIYKHFHLTQQINPSYLNFNQHHILFDTASVKAIIFNCQNFLMESLIYMNIFLVLCLFILLGSERIRMLLVIDKCILKPIFFVLIVLFFLIYISLTIQGDFLSTPAIIVFIYILFSLNKLNLERHQLLDKKEN